jgi:hypothetical protein
VSDRVDVGTSKGGGGDGVDALRSVNQDWERTSRKGSSSRFSSASKYSSRDEAFECRSGSMVSE